MYSSGTGGPGQGVLMPHAHGTPFGLGGFESVQLQADDPGYAVLPLHHVNGLLMQLGATLLPGTPAIVRRRIWPAPGWTISARTAPRSPVAQERGVGVPGIGSTKYRSSRIRP
jgi:crotonobetaine/carnitine-CoA ligase